MHSSRTEVTDRSLDRLQLTNIGQIIIHSADVDSRGDAIPRVKLRELLFRSDWIVHCHGLFHPSFDRFMFDTGCMQFGVETEDFTGQRVVFLGDVGLFTSTGRQKQGQNGKQRSGKNSDSAGAGRFAFDVQKMTQRGNSASFSLSNKAESPLFHSSASSGFLCLGLRLCALDSIGRAGLGLPTRSRAMALTSLFTSNFLRFIALRPESQLALPANSSYNEDVHPK